MIDASAVVGGGDCAGVHTFDAMIFDGRNNTVTGNRSLIVGGEGVTVHGADSVALYCHGVHLTADRSFAIDNQPIADDALRAEVYSYMRRRGRIPRRRYRT